jgi:hypothetical protein
MKPNSLPKMTVDQFEAEAEYIDEGWWMTGEGFIHVQSVMEIPNWNFYGSEGNRSLTPAQRTLMAWSDIVGQVSNGGFVQLFDNYSSALSEIVEAVEALHWDDLDRYFVAAMIEQGGSVSNPKVEKPEKTDDKEWFQQRELLIEHLVRSRDSATRSAEPKTLASRDFGLKLLKKSFDRQDQNWFQRLLDVLRRRRWRKSWREWLHEFYDDDALRHLHALSMLRGGFPGSVELKNKKAQKPTKSADEFDAWFFSERCKKDSCRVVRSFINEHSDELYERVE